MGSQVWIFALAPFVDEKLLQKADDQGENSFAKSRVSRDWTLFQKTPIRLRSDRELTRGRSNRTQALTA